MLDERATPDVAEDQARELMPRLRHSVLATDNCIADVEATGVVIDNREPTGFCSSYFFCIINM